MAFETTRILEERGPVARLFVSAARPRRRSGRSGEDTLGDDAIVAELRRLGGVPEPLLKDPETVREVLHLLRSDHRALRRYRCQDGARLTAPLTVLLAETDPKNSAEQMRDWARHTKEEHGVEMLSGGHFSLVERATESAPLLTRYLRAARACAGTARNTPQGARTDLVREILLARLDGHTPRLSTDLTTLEAAAREILAPTAYAYVAGTSGSGSTGRANREAFDQGRPAVHAAVGEGVPVLMGSGVRTGSDVVKALAPGTDAVLYARPYVYGLGLDAQGGVEHLLWCLLTDLDLTLALTGCPALGDIGAGPVVPRGHITPDSIGSSETGKNGTRR